AARERVAYLLRANSLGGATHRQPLSQSRWGNDENEKSSRGLFGSLATWEDAQHQRWVLYPMWGPPAKAAPKFEYSYGPANRGSVMAFRLAAENEKPAPVPVWMSRDMHVPDAPAVATGVVYVVATGENTRQGGYFPAEVRAK